MPDIKTALQQALAKTATDWAADDEAHLKIAPKQEKTMPQATPTPTPAPAPAPEVNPTKSNNGVNVSRSTFEYIRDNPGHTIDQITDTLVARGFNSNSVSSLCYQMMRVRLVVADANGKLSAVVREYVPIQTSLIRKRKAKPKAAPVKAVAPAPVPVPEPIVEAPVQRKRIEITNTRTGEVFNTVPEKPWEPKDVIDKLTVRQAIALFKELRNILVG